MKETYEIKEEYTYKLEVMKSIFYSFLFRVETKEEAKLIIDKIRKEYIKAKHVVYAYIINDDIKFSDDGEPSGTAGKPLLELLKKKNLNNAIVIVARIFGGTLLGASRLLRTYNEAASMVINKAKLYVIYGEYLNTLNVKLENITLISGYLKKNKYEIKNIEYDEISTIEFYSKNDVLSKICDSFYGIILNASTKEVKRSKEVEK